MQGDFAFLRHQAFAGVTNLHPHRGRGTRHLLEALAPVSGQRLIEVGCGTGGTLTHIAIAHHTRVYGVDLLSEMLDVAHRRLRWSGLQSHASVYQADAVALPFLDRSFDGGYAESALGFHAVARVRQILREIVRVLRTGARFAANELVWLPGISDEEVQTIWRSTVQNYGLAPALDAPWTWQDWSKELKAAGFSVLANQALNPCASHPSWSPREFPSFALTNLYKLRGLLSMRHLQDRLAYRRRMQQDAIKRPVLEPRLFVLEKAG